MDDSGMISGRSAFSLLAFAAGFLAGSAETYFDSGKRWPTTKPTNPNTAPDSIGPTIAANTEKSAMGLHRNAMIKPAANITKTPPTTMITAIFTRTFPRMVSTCAWPRGLVV